MMIEKLKEDKFTQEEKNIINELVEKKTLACECRDLSRKEAEYHIKRRTKSVEKFFKCLSLLVFGVFLFFLVLYIGDKEECGFMHPWLFILCIALSLYLFAFGHWWGHKCDKKVYEFKRVVLKYSIIYPPKSVPWNVYSIAELMPDGEIRYFGIRGEKQKDDELFEGKLLLADMIREKGQTKTMFDIDRKSIRSVGV